MNQGNKIVTETPPKATEQFYAQVGGTPQEVATRFIGALRNSGQAFHATAKGASRLVDAYTVTANPVTVYWDMPAFC
jgi:hypothetical protein